MINGSAKSAGVPNDKLPFPKVSAPTKRHSDIVEYMGFSYKLDLPGINNNNTESEIEEDGGDDDAAAAEREKEFESIFQDVCDDLDIEVVVPDREYVAATNQCQFSE